MKKKAIFLLLIITLIFILGEKAAPETNIKNNKTINIDGEPEPASVTDIPLPAFDYDFDSFEIGFNPEKELIDLLDRAEDLTGSDNKQFSLDFPIEK